MRYLLILLGIWFLSAASWAKVIVPIELKNGKTFKVAIHEYVNPNGQSEMRFETDNLSKVILGHARDVDQDGKIETFFIFGDNGIARYHRDILVETNLGAARAVLTNHAKYSGGDYFIGMATHVLTFLFIAVDHINEAHQNWYRDWMDLEELSMEIERNKASLSNDELIYAYNLVLEAGQLALKQFEDAFYKEYPAWWVADAVLWLSGGVVVKWAGKGIGVVGKRILPRLKKLGGVAATRLGIKLGMNSYRATVRSTIKGITAKGLMGRGKGLMVKGLKNVRAEWKYLAFSAGIQVGVESFVNYDEIYDPEPKTMARKMIDHPGIQENVSISVADSLAMTAAHSMAQTRVGKFALLGMVGASSSLGVGVGLDGEQSKDRVMFDTAWSVGVDSLQIMMDLHVLHKFQKMAIKARNPKLKLVGYAIVFVSQVVGYYGYAHATQYFDPKDEKEGQVQLVPVHVAAN